MSPAETRMDGFSLCFTVADGSIGSESVLVSGDEGPGFSVCGWEGHTVYVADLEHAPGAHKLNLSLVAEWHDPIPMKIDFVP
jgi:hypothetical protein